MAGKPSVTVPENFGRYHIVKPLGQGGMGAVYLAQDTELDRHVALKVPNLSVAEGSGILERFYREARAAATLRHPNICPVFDIGEHDGIPFLTMAFIEGKALCDFAHAKPLTQKQAATLVRKLALALNEAHQRGVIHRDLKPANIMIDRRGEPIVMDFGLARRLKKDDPRLTRTGAAIGTPAYMPPEQISTTNETMGPACDIYSLGVILYELLAGRLPFSGDVMAMLAQILTDVPPRPSAFKPDIDPALEAICMKAMTKKPEERFQSMAEMASALQDFLRGRTPSPAAVETQQPGPKETQPDGVPLSMLGGQRSMAQAGQQIRPRQPARAASPAFRRKPRRRKLPMWLWICIDCAAMVFLIALLALGWRLFGPKPEATNLADAASAPAPLLPPAAGKDQSKAIPTTTKPSRSKAETQLAAPTVAAADGQQTTPVSADRSRTGFDRPASTATEVMTLSELPTNAFNSSPWVSPDGLKLYWTSVPVGEKQRWIWSAERKHKFTSFENHQKLLPGTDPTVSADGLVMIYLNEVNLYEVSRANSFQPFGKPRKIVEFDGVGFLCAPCLSDDGLVLYADRTIDRKTELVRFTRSSRSEPWRAPTAVVVAAPGPSSVRFFWVSAGGRRAFGCIPDRLQDPGVNNLVMFSSTHQGLNWEAPTFIEVPGLSISGKFPRYVAATGELFYSTGVDPNGTAQIRVIRNFDPDKLAPKPGSTASNDRNPAPRQEAPRPTAPAGPKPLPRGVWTPLDPARASAWEWDGKSGRNFKSYENGVLRLDNAGLNFINLEAQNFSLSAKVKMLGQSASIHLRTRPGDQGYWAGCAKESGGMIAFRLGVTDQQGNAKSLRVVRRKDTYGEFISLRLTAAGNLLTIHAGGEKVIEMQDSTKPRPGWPGVSAHHSLAFFKDIEVKLLDD